MRSASGLGRLVQLAADGAARERCGVVVDVVRARVLAQLGTGRAGIGRRGAALPDVARTRRRGTASRKRDYDRAGDPDGGLVDVARNECLWLGLLIWVLNVIARSSRTLIIVWPLALEVEPVVSFLAVSRACRTHIVLLPLFAVSRRRSRGLAAANSDCVAPAFSLEGPRPEGRIRHRTHQISRDVVRSPPKNGPACAGDRPPPTQHGLPMSLEP